jgi:hypothetical protein
LWTNGNEEGKSRWPIRGDFRDAVKLEIGGREQRLQFPSPHPDPLPSFMFRWGKALLLQGIWNSRAEPDLLDDRI